MESVLIVIGVIAVMLLAFWVDHNDTVKRELRYQVKDKQKQEIANGEKQWPTALDWCLGIGFVIGFFGLLIFVGHAAGF